MKRVQHAWTKEDCETIVYMREYLKLKFAYISHTLSREFGTKISKSSAIARYNRLKENGFTYTPSEVERV